MFCVILYGHSLVDKLKWYISVLNIACTCLWFFFCAQFRVFLDDLTRKLYCLNCRNFSNASCQRCALVPRFGMYCRSQKSSAVLPNTPAVDTAWPLLVGWLSERSGSVTPLSKTCNLENIRGFPHFSTSVKSIEDAWWCVRIAWPLN